MYQTSQQGIQRKATAEEIINRLPQETMFERYLGVSVQTSHKFCSPLRTDTYPTCTFSWYGGKLWFRDWSENRPWDIFSVVQNKYMVDFHTAVQIIAEDFGLVNGDVDRSAIGYRKDPFDFKGDKRNKRSSEKSRIGVKVQPFTKHDIEYLNSYHIQESTAKFYKVFGVRTVWVNDNRIYDCNDTDPALAYYFGTDDHHHQKWKVYFYNRTENWRFISNTNRINGWIQIPATGDYLVITKSMKDVMCFAEYGIPAISMQAENQIPYDYIIEELKDRYKNIYTLYDFDLAGIRAANAIRKLYDIKPLFLTTGKLGTYNYEYKDFSDYIQAKGYMAGKELIKSVKSNCT